MPKRVLDFDALWGSDKLAACAPWAQAEYAWLYGLADASGCFEITNLRVIWGRVAAIRTELTLERLGQIFAEFQDKGLLFVWEHEGKRYAHWTGSDVPGRLPPPSWRMRLERFAPPVPKPLLAQYMGRFARGRAVLAGTGFGAETRAGFSDGCRDGERAEAARAGNADSRNLNRENVNRENLRFEISDLKLKDQNLPSRGAVPGAASGTAAGVDRCKDGLEAAQGQDLDLGLNWDGKREWNEDRDREARGGPGHRSGLSETSQRDLFQTSFSEPGSEKRENTNTKPSTGVSADLDGTSRGAQYSESRDPRSSLQGDARRDSHVYVYPRAMSAKELALERELRVGQGPVCGPGGVKPEVLERIRQRELARKAARGSD